MVSLLIYSVDPCVFPDTNEFYYWYQIMDCFTSIPFNDTIRQHTITNLEKAMQLYTFLDIAADPPDPVIGTPKVDLLKLLESFRSTDFGNDFILHYSLHMMFLQLHDAHTNVSFLPPFPHSFIIFKSIMSLSTIEVSTFTNHSPLFRM
jgi:hypothetical protein